MNTHHYLDWSVETWYVGVDGTIRRAVQSFLQRPISMLEWCLIIPQLCMRDSIEQHIRNTVNVAVPFSRTLTEGLLHAERSMLIVSHSFLQAASISHDSRLSRRLWKSSGDGTLTLEFLTQFFYLGIGLRRDKGLEGEFSQKFLGVTMFQVPGPVWKPQPWLVLALRVRSIGAEVGGQGGCEVGKEQRLLRIKQRGKPWLLKKRLLVLASQEKADVLKWSRLRE